MKQKYSEYKQLNLTGIANEILEMWETGNVFQKSISLREGSSHYVFYEGPPSANGMPGIHHVISRTLKDLVCRYKTMQGFQVQRKGGWDTHGLPIELGVEKVIIKRLYIREYMLNVFVEHHTQTLKIILLLNARSRYMEMPAGLNC